MHALFQKIPTVCFFVLMSLAHTDTTLYYAFQTDAGGGIARLRADPVSGELLEHERLFVDARAGAIKKVTVSGSGRYLAANMEEVRHKNNMAVMDLDTGEVRFFDFRREVDHVQFFGENLYIGTTAGGLFRLNPEAGTFEAHWDFREILDPSGRRPENFFLDEEGNIFWVSFQKDSDSHNHRGSRIVGIDLHTDTVISDLQLPRDRPELHYDPEVRGREAGPSPEVLHVSSEHNLLWVTLDLYGGIGFADLDAARQGELKNWTVLSTAPDESWGTAFPDRVGRFQFMNRELLAVANASDPGGLVIFDVESRRIVQRLDVPGGLSTLHFLPVVNRVVSGTPGKIKARGPDRLLNESTPRPLWAQLIWRGSAFEAEVRPMETLIHRVAPLSASDSPLVYLNVGDDAEVWWVIHPEETEPRQRIPAFGRVQRTSR
ncbi:MAG: hypothetical protein JJU05_06160 [Verrucomicrobia bacterium]|nr:hypothetical protein [Verrucomicrobiota bacterium]MCH8525775.1 hypothetical protein [Kiritimatiellia bacterium]